MILQVSSFNTEIFQVLPPNFQQEKHNLNQKINLQDLDHIIVYVTKINKQYIVKYVMFDSITFRKNIQCQLGKKREKKI